MAVPPVQPISGAELLGIFEQSFGADPQAYRRTLNASPLEDVMGSSQALDYLRQRLPQNLGATQLGQNLASLLPDSEDPKSAASRVRQAINAFPLGGYSQQYLQNFREERAANPKLQYDTVEVGKVPALGGGEVPTGDRLRAAAAQAAGVAAADFTSDGLRNLWWFLNAPQAISTLAVLQAVNKSGQDFVDPDSDGNLLKRGRLRLAAAVPAWIGMSMAVGGFGRQPGYTAAVPSEADATQTADPLAEVGARYVLGRTGSLLPYDEFVKERPDVSRREYEEYKAYLFGNKLPLKATMEGIQGPEVTFLGKSIPVLTGLLPAVAAVAGAGYGVRKAGQILSGVDRSGKRVVDASGKRMPDRLQQESALLDEAFATGRLPDDQRDVSDFTDLRKLREVELGLDPKRRVVEPSAQFVEAYGKYRDLERANQYEILKQALVHSSLGLTGAALGGQTLEFIRRSLDSETAASNPQVTGS